MLTPNVERWRDAGGFEQVAGRRLYVQRREGEGPLLLFLHGFPSSSYDWRELLALRAGPRGAAVRLPRLRPVRQAGRPSSTRSHGRPTRPRSSCGAPASPPVYVVAHDMGTSVATELFARELRGEAKLDIRGALLFNGSILLDRASPTTGQKLLRSRLGPLFARLTTQRSFRLQFGRIFSDAHPLARAGGGRPVGAARARPAATASATCSSTTWPSASATSSAGTAPSATGPGALSLDVGAGGPGRDDRGARRAARAATRRSRVGAAGYRPLSAARAARPDRGRARRRARGGHMTDDSFDVIVIGAGPAGEVGRREAGGARQGGRARRARAGRRRVQLLGVHAVEGAAAAGRAARRDRARAGRGGRRAGARDRRGRRAAPPRRGDPRAERRVADAVAGAARRDAAARAGAARRRAARGASSATAAPSCRGARGGDRRDRVGRAAAADPRPRRGASRGRTARRRRPTRSPASCSCSAAASSASSWRRRGRRSARA